MSLLLITVLAIHVSDWDIRKIVLQGLTKPFLRYASSAYERASHKIRNMRKEGKNVTQFLVLANFGGFNAFGPNSLNIDTTLQSSIGLTFNRRSASVVDNP